MDAKTYDRFTEAICTRLMQDDRVIALIVLGSTAAPDRRDQWSDHDFWLITRPGNQERFLADLDWLPDSHDIVFTFRQGAHYSTVLYQSGTWVEYAVFDPVQMLQGKLDRYSVLFDGSGTMAETCRRVAAGSMETVRRERESPPDSEILSYFFLQIMVGVQRYARGERLSADQMVRGLAVGNLLTLVSRYIEPGNASWQDGFDIRRHFETVYPEVGHEIDQALARPLPELAVALLDIADDRLARRVPGYPHRVAAVVRQQISGRNARSVEAGR